MTQEFPTKLDDRDLKIRQKLGERREELALEELDLIKRNKELDKRWRLWRRLITTKYKLRPEDTISDFGEIERADKDDKDQ